MKVHCLEKPSLQQHADAHATTHLLALATAAVLFGTSLALAPAATAHAEMLTAAAAPNAVAAQTPPAIPATFSIVNYGSGLCLEPAGSGWGEPILQQPCDSMRPMQRWLLSPATATRSLLVNQATGLCMDVRDGVNANRTVVQLWSCNLYARSMRWGLATLIPDLYFKAVSEIGSRCLDVAAGSLQPGAQIQIYDCTRGVTNAAQIFAFQ
jgi:Ricin-type beta-trefoil lectin domain-like